MKFTKEDAFKQIESLLTDNGKKDLLLSKRSVNAQIDTLLPLLADDETELSAFVDKVKPVFQTMYGNLKYDTSQFAKKWIEDHPEPKPKDAEDKGAGISPEMQALMDRIDKLEKDKAAADAAAAVSAKRAALAKAMADKGVSDKEWVDSLLSEIAVDAQTDIEASADKYLKLYNRSHAQTPVGVAPKGGAGQGEQGSPFADISAKFQAARQREKGNIENN